MKTARQLLAALTALLSSCTCLPRPPVPYHELPNIPDRPVSSLIRNVVIHQPWFGHKAFYGRYGGFGDYGGRPIDDLDEVFRRHDIVYNEARSFRALCWADDAAAIAINHIDPCHLSPAGREFRERARRFFMAPCWRWVGKPLDSYLFWSERPNSPFRTRERVFTFFALPDPDVASRFACGEPLPEHSREPNPSRRLPRAN